MHRFSRSIIIRTSIEEAFLFHTDVRNLVQITPSFLKVNIVHADPPGLGQHVLLRILQFGFIPLNMHMEFFVYDFPHCLADRQLKGPFTSMVQHRYFEDVGGGYTRMEDIFEYSLPFGIFGRFAHVLLMRKLIEHMFVYRQNETKKLLEK
ncbi:MAG: SRPBCC family protein [Bacteroidota bacterium]